MCGILLTLGRSEVPPGVTVTLGTWRRKGQRRVDVSPQSSLGRPARSCLPAGRRGRSGRRSSTPVERTSGAPASPRAAFSTPPTNSVRPRLAAAGRAQVNRWRSGVRSAILHRDRCCRRPGPRLAPVLTQGVLAVTAAVADATESGSRACPRRAQRPVLACPPGPCRGGLSEGRGRVDNENADAAAEAGCQREKEPTHDESVHVDQLPGRVEPV
jgi:hypothetical protein